MILIEGDSILFDIRYQCAVQWSKFPLDGQVVPVRARVQFRGTAEMEAGFNCTDLNTQTTTVSTKMLQGLL